MNILIVDDTKYQLSLYRMYLEKQGHTITEASDGEAALELNWTLFDVVVMDLLMPKMNGDEVARKSIEKWGHRVPPILIFTALDNNVIQQLTLRLPPGVKVFQKGGTKDEVLAMIDEAVNATATAIAYSGS